MYQAWDFSADPRISADFEIPRGGGGGGEGEFFIYFFPPKICL